MSNQDARAADALQALNQIPRVTAVAGFSHRLAPERNRINVHVLGMSPSKVWPDVDAVLVHGFGCELVTDVAHATRSYTFPDREPMPGARVTTERSMSVQLTDEEYAQVEADAAACEVTTSDYIKGALLYFAYAAEDNQK